MRSIGGRRVVVTGIGLVTPLGCGSQAIWQLLCQGKHGIHLETFHPLQEFAVATVPRGEGVHDFHEDTMDTHMKENPKFIQYAIHAAQLAVADARWTHGIDKTRAGVCIASGIGSIDETTKAHDALQVSHRKVSPYFVPRILVNMAAAHVSIKFGLQGPLQAPCTACAAGAHAIGDAYNLIRLNYADTMLAGGTESSINSLAIAGFHRLKALSTIHSAQGASRPFDTDRKGFVMGEGAGVLILEELETALSRGATIIAELTGYGISADAHHITSPSPNGDGAYRAMSSALRDAQLQPNDIKYINAHATSTPTGDEIEAKAIENLFHASGKDLFVSSTKGATGHLLGAAGAVEAAFTAFAVRDGLAPPTLNLISPIDANFSFVSENTATIKGLTHGLSNSFGFGGTNCSLIMSKYTT